MKKPSMGKPLTSTMSVIVDGHLGPRRSVLAPGKSVREVHRHLQEAGGVLRSDGAPSEAYLHQEGAGIHHMQNMRGQEGSRALQP